MKVAESYAGFSENHAKKSYCESTSRILTLCGTNSAIVNCFYRKKVLSIKHKYGIKYPFIFTKYYSPSVNLHICFLRLMAFLLIGMLQAKNQFQVRECLLPINKFSFLVPDKWTSESVPDE